jgi:hypothetical protein
MFQSERPSSEGYSTTSRKDEILKRRGKKKHLSITLDGVDKLL